MTDVAGKSQVNFSQVRKSAELICELRWSLEGEAGGRRLCIRVPLLSMVEYATE